MANLYLDDDGTLDTVVSCADCGWTGRYNPEFEDGNGDDRIEQALSMAEEDHPDCEDEDESAAS